MACVCPAVPFISALASQKAPRELTLRVSVRSLEQQKAHSSGTASWIHLRCKHHQQKNGAAHIAFVAHLCILCLQTDKQKTNSYFSFLR